MLETLEAIFGMFSGYNIIGVAFISAVALGTVSTVLFLTRKIRIHNLIKNYAKNEAEIRDITSKKIRTNKLLPKLVKHEKMRMKAARRRINLKMENLSGNLVFNNSRISKTAAFQIINEAKLNLLKMKDYQKGSLKEKINLAKIHKVEKVLASTKKNNNVLPRVDEVVRFDDAVTKLTSNHLACYNPDLLKEYQKALDASKDYYPVRKEGKTSYPMFFEVRDEQGELIYSLSDVSPVRYQKFSNEILASIINELPNSGRGDAKGYKIIAFDSYKNKEDKSFTYFESRLDYKEDIYDVRKQFNEYSENHFKIPQESLGLVSEHDFIRRTNVAEFKAKTSEMQKQNKTSEIIFNKSDSSLNSDLLKVIHQRTKQKVDFGQSHPFPIQTKLTINGDNMLTVIDDTTDVYYAMKDYYDAYACILSILRETNDLSTQINVSTTSMVEKADTIHARRGMAIPQYTKDLETVPSINYLNAYTVFKKLRTNPKFMDAFALLSRDFNIPFNNEFFQELGITLSPEEIKNFKDKKWDAVYAELMGNESAQQTAKSTKNARVTKTAARTTRAADPSSITYSRKQTGNYIKTTFPRIKKEFAEDLQRYGDATESTSLSLDVKVAEEGEDSKAVVNLFVKAHNQTIFHKYYLKLLTEAYILVANREQGVKNPKIELNFAWGIGPNKSSTMVFNNLPGLERYITTYAEKNAPEFNFEQNRDILQIEYSKGDRSQE